MSHKHPSLDDGLGDGEHRTEPYMEYGEGGEEPATPPGAKSAGRVLGSAQKQASARRVFALVDCNNFFVSCERIFRPDLEGRPVVVLSSNDGCAVARSNEAKVLGIPMGAPAFKYKQLFKNNGVVSFSANFELYGDISRRITRILTEATPRTEVYSIDESFLDLSNIAIDDYGAWGRWVRERIWREVGIPVAIGVAPTKTLAKLATERAKKDSELDGVLDMTGLPLQQISAYRDWLPLEEVWGIGRRLAPKLRAIGLQTAEDIARLRPQLAGQLMGFRGRQLVSELNGISCLPLEDLHQIAKSIARTRTFGEDTSDFHVLEAAVASFATQAAYRLRASGQLTNSAGLFLTTSRHKPGYKVWSREIRLDNPTADSGAIMKVLTDELARIFDPSRSYHRAGVWLHDFVSAGKVQSKLFEDLNRHRESILRMRSIDLINSRFGKGTVYYAAEDLAKTWKPKHGARSPRYVSDWMELPKVRPA